MIKILNVITDTNIGGAGNVLLNYMRNADRTGFDHTVIVPENSMLTPGLRALDVRTMEMPGIAERSFSIGAISAFRRKYDEIRPAVLHTHASLSARIAAKRWGKCAVVHTRHCAYPQGRLKTSFPGKQALGFINNSLSDMIIAISPATRDSLIETGTDAGKIITMFNGVDPVRKISEDEKRAFRTSIGVGDEFICAIVARLVPEKGHEYVLEAAHLLRDLPIRFVLAGSGPLESTLRETVASKGLTNCVFTGFLDDVAPLDNIADVQLNASYLTETSSLSLLEGMSLGTPAIASDVGGNPHLVENGVNGLVVPPRDSAALADAIRKLYGSPDELARMGENALAAYNSRFNASFMAARIEDVYRTAASRYSGSTVE